MAFPWYISEKQGNITILLQLVHCHCKNYINKQLQEQKQCHNILIGSYSNKKKNIIDQNILKDWIMYFADKHQISDLTRLFSLSHTQQISYSL